MSTLQPLRDVIAAYGLNANKALGQNFLFDEQLLDKIVAIPGDLTGASVFEVGPGPGGLTRALLRAGALVTAVERDARCLPALEEVAAAFPARLSVIAGDAMKLDSDAVFAATPYHIAANLPYNIGTALFVRWLESPIWPPRWQSLTLMFQHEVAQRIIAKPDTGAYGRLSVLAQWRCSARLAMRVHRSAFTPPPKVMSAVVHVTPTAMPDGVNPRLLSAVTAAAFGQRRKMLRQSLKGVTGAHEAMEALSIEPTRRAETLSVGEFVSIARCLSANANC